MGSPGLRLRATGFGQARMPGHRGGVEDLLDLRFGEQLLLADEFHDALAGAEGLGGELGGLLVADDAGSAR